MSGIEKEIDALGRVVIPAKFRKRMGIESDATVLVSMEDDAVLISPISKRCALCGDKIEKDKKYRLCESCIFKIKAE